MLAHRGLCITLIVTTSCKGRVTLYFIVVFPWFSKLFSQPRALTPKDLLTLQHLLPLHRWSTREYPLDAVHCNRSLWPCCERKSWKWVILGEKFWQSQDLRSLVLNSNKTGNSQISCDKFWEWRKWCSCVIKYVHIDQPLPSSGNCSRSTANGVDRLQMVETFFPKP